MTTTDVEEQTEAMDDSGQPFPPLVPERYDYRVRFTAALRRYGWTVTDTPKVVDATHPELPLRVKGHFRVGAYGYYLVPHWKGNRQEFAQCPPEGRAALWKVIQAIIPSA